MFLDIIVFLRRITLLKKFVFFLCLASLVIPVSTFAQKQAKPLPSTKLEQFLSKKGKLIVKDSFDSGTLSGQYGTKISVDALMIYEPGKEKEKICGLRIEVEGAGRLERSDTSFLDLEEVESLSKAISYMINLVDNWKSKSRNYTEVIFSTKGDFRLGFYQKGTEMTGFAQSGTRGTATCYFSVTNLSELKGIIDRGNSLLK